MSYKDEILRLRSEGLSYREIEKRVGCCRGTISYYCGEGQKEKSRNRQRTNRAKRHPFQSKVERFAFQYSQRDKKISKTSWEKLLYAKLKRFIRMPDDKYGTPEFTVQDVLDKVGDTPKCYLTGRPINIHDTSSYHFDHILPRSKGGDNSLDNLGIAVKDANLAKRGLTVEEFVQLCKDVVEYN